MQLFDADLAEPYEVPSCNILPPLLAMGKALDLKCYLVGKDRELQLKVLEVVMK